MATGVRVGVGGAVKTVKGIYVGVGGQVKKVTKGYVGVGGVPKLFWTADPISYSTQAPPFNGSSNNTSPYRGENVGNYALFNTETIACGYNSSLTRTATTARSKYNGSYESTTITNVYAMIGGGWYDSGDRLTPATYSWDTSLTGKITSMLQNRKYQHATAKVGNYGLFAGGCEYSSTNNKEWVSVDAFDTALTNIEPTDLSQDRYALGGGYNTAYAIFAGGMRELNDGYDYHNNVDAYNTSLTKSTATVLSNGRHQISIGGSTGNYALFLGGRVSGNAVTTVEGYNTSLTKVSVAALSTASTSLIAYYYNNKCYVSTTNTTTEIYDSSLSKTIITRSVAGAIRCYARTGASLFMANAATNTIDVYSIS